MENFEYKRCRGCRFDWWDRSVGYSECIKADDFNDAEFEEYQILGYVIACPYFEDAEEEYKGMTEYIEFTRENVLDIYKRIK